MSFSGFNKPSDIEDAYQRQLKLVRARIRNSQLLSKAELDKSQGVEPLVPPARTTQQKLQDEGFQIQLGVKNLGELLKDRDEVGKVIGELTPTDIRVVNQNFPYFMKDLGNYDLLTAEFFLDYFDNFKTKIKNSKGLVSGLSPQDIAEALVEEAGKKLKNELGDAVDYKAVLEKLISLNQPVEVGAPSTGVAPQQEGEVGATEGEVVEEEGEAPVEMIIPSQSIPVVSGVPNYFTAREETSIDNSLSVGQWSYQQMKKLDGIDIYDRLDRVNTFLNKFFDENGDIDMDLVSTTNLRNIKKALNIGNKIIQVIDKVRSGKKVELTKKYIDRANSQDIRSLYDDFEASKEAIDSVKSELEAQAKQLDKPIPKPLETVEEEVAPLGLTAPAEDVADEGDGGEGDEELDLFGQSPTGGYGLKKRMMKRAVNPKRLIQKMVKVGRGLKPDVAEPKYVEWGDKFVLHKKQLEDGVFNIKYAKNFSTYHQLRPQRVSMDLVDIIEDTIQGGRVNKKMYETLKDGDKEFFEKIVEIGGLSRKLGVRKSSNENFKKEMDRFELVRGQFVAGNNNPEVIKELKQFIIKFLMDNRITKSEGKELLLSLSTY